MFNMATLGTFAAESRPDPSVAHRTDSALDTRKVRIGDSWVQTRRERPIPSHMATAGAALIGTAPPRCRAPRSGGRRFELWLRRWRRSGRTALVVEAMPEVGPARCRGFVQAADRRGDRRPLERFGV